MAATPSIKVVKQFTRKGTVQRFSNRYHFNGGTPSDGAHWKTFMDLIPPEEKLIYPSTVTIVEIIGYAAGSDVPVHTESYSVAGTLSIPVNCVQGPADSCGLVRYATTARTSKNHPVYLFNYYHGVLLDTAITDGQDIIPSGQVSAYGEYADDWIAGFSDGVNTYVRAGPNGATGVGHFEDGYVRHRDFPE